MLYNLFHYFIRRTHFWRYIGFAEMAELYTSRMLRVMAMQMIGGFSAVYLYQLGYSLQFIAWFFFFNFAYRLLVAPLVALLVARYGPKHGTLLSNVGQTIGYIALVLTPEFGITAIVLFAIFAGASRSLYDVCYLVDFSKVKHIDHAGKELGIMQIIERVMTALGPLLGGLVALFFGPQVMLLFGSVLMFIAAWPLFFTSEPTKIHQKITLRHFNFKVTWKPIVANIATGIDVNASGLIWNLFLAIIVLNSASPEVYVQIGGLSSISLFVSIAIAYMYGKIVDKHQGKTLLRLSVIGDALLYLVRPFTSTPVQVVGINVANEIATTGYAIPATRGIFDTADGLPGYRIVYMTIMGATLVLGDAIASLILALLLGLLEEKTALQSFYFVMAPIMLIILFHATAIYRRGVLTRFIHRV